MPPKPPSADRLAAALAERLDQVVPSGLSVRSTGASIDVYSSRGVWHAGAGAGNIDNDDGRSIEERVEGIAWYILSGAQDAVMEILTEQWPVALDGRAAEPGSRVVGGQLHMWFGDEQTPLVALPALSLQEVLGGAA